jgi:hypothetical protein
MTVRSKIAQHLQRARKEKLSTFKYRQDAFFNWMKLAFTDSKEFRSELTQLNERLNQLVTNMSLTRRDFRKMYSSWILRSNTQRRRMFSEYTGVARGKLLELLRAYAELNRGKQALDELNSLLKQLRNEVHKAGDLRQVPPLRMSKYELERDAI